MLLLLMRINKNLKNKFNKNHSLRNLKHSLLRSITRTKVLMFLVLLSRKVLRRRGVVVIVLVSMVRSADTAAFVTTSTTSGSATCSIGLSCHGFRDLWNNYAKICVINFFRCLRRISSQCVYFYDGVDEIYVMRIKKILWPVVLVFTFSRCHLFIYSGKLSVGLKCSRCFDMRVSKQSGDSRSFTKRSFLKPEILRSQL